MASPVSGGGWSVRINVFGRQMQADVEGDDADIRRMLGLGETATATGQAGQQALQRYGENLQRFLEAQIVQNENLQSALAHDALPQEVEEHDAENHLATAVEGLEGAVVRADQIELPSASKAIQWVDLTDLEASGSSSAASTSAERIRGLLRGRNQELWTWTRHNSDWRPGPKPVDEEDVLNLARRHSLPQPHPEP
jgi:hypothetical protein